MDNKVEDKESQERHSVTILVNGSHLTFNLNQSRESVMREAAGRLQEVENQMRSRSRLTDDRDYFRYTAILIASRLVSLEREKDASDKHTNEVLEDILKIVQG
ncbi:MAG: cell division protein ZapA [Rikenellaceae bacterium]